MNYDKTSEHSTMIKQNTCRRRSVIRAVAKLFPIINV